MLPYVEALGEPRLGESEAARRVAAAWRALREKLDESPGAPPVRVFVNHYPRPELPGFCVTVQVIVYDVNDLFLAREKPRAFAAYARLARRAKVPGRILELRQVWQLEGTPRLVGALAEVTDRFRFPTGHRHLDPRGFDDRKAAQVVFDTVAGAHFPIYGGGDRHGLVWADRSAGIGAPSPTQMGYAAPARARLDDSPRTGVHAISVTELGPDDAARLRAYVRRG